MVNFIDIPATVIIGLEKSSFFISADIIGACGIQGQY
jgi:hypothetical protein